MRILALLLLFLPVSALCQSYTVETVPNVKTTDGLAYTANPDGLLKAETVMVLDSLCKAIEDSTTAEVAVVVLNSIGQEEPKSFATNLFAHWGLGKAGKDNGLLVLVVMDQRAIEFETGYGMESVLTDAGCYAIQQDYMIPRFREENPDQGMIDALVVIQQMLYGNAEVIALVNAKASYEKPPETEYTEAEEAEAVHTPNPWYMFTGMLLLDIYIWLCIIYLVVALLVILVSQFQKDLYRRYTFLHPFSAGALFVFFPVHLFIGPLVRKMKERARNATRFSPKTGLMMHKLDEEADNQYLQAGNITEEKVRSIDYDVWVSGEPDDILVLKYPYWGTKYSACPKCKFKTYFKEYDRTISSPTYSSSGTGQRKYTCSNCKHSAVSTYTIPKLVRSSSTGSSGGGWSGGSSSSSSWSSGSSSRSSGGSWGGGRSGGGGAGSRW
jgi:uncharacterized protein